jgi:hypothetical protein
MVHKRGYWTKVSDKSSSKRRKKKAADGWMTIQYNSI